ncbi:FxSxx-COOH system tetratricopeptide repeat protein [Kutzneria sp. CA-103260]|uniref:FxSxx-COOH system tetratricopeptide repeat protein n=1 Tax=Kutzneria sp. CA-103260 TaxID=2802641 RepID=UPI001BA77EB0|nr:FxSxx-COOH system tetratricopeptide repeat protein [Kutzneria sp. CA-103260]
MPPRGSGTDDGRADTVGTADLYPFEVADAFFVAAHLARERDEEQVDRQAETPGNTAETRRLPTERGEPRRSVHLTQPQPRAPDPPSPGIRPAEAVGRLRRPREGHGTLPATPAAPMVEWPAMPGLHSGRKIARALRPFKRTVPARFRQELDEDATAEQAAGFDGIPPVMRPASDRPLEAVLVVDSSESMVIWRRTAAEFRTLLEREGAFSTVRLFHLDTDQVKPLSLRTENDNTALTPSRLLDPTGRRLIVVLTDGIGAAWQESMTQQWLARWGRCGPVAVVNVLPQSLWHWSSLEPAAATLRAAAPRVANTRLRCGFGDLEPPPGVVPIPLLELDERSLGRWARLVADPAPAPVALTVLPTMARPPRLDEPLTEPEPQPPAEPAPEHRVRRFRAASSRTAFRLAVLLAAAPLNVPTMMLVQREMLPGSRLSHLAEVFLSGLLHRVGTGAVTDPESVAYEFRDGVRQELLAAGFRQDTMRVLRLIADRLAPTVSAMRGLRDALRSPDTTEHPDVADDGSRRFAAVEQAVMAALGGEYSRRGKALRAELEQARSSSEQVGAEVADEPSVTYPNRSDELEGTPMSYSHSGTAARAGGVSIHPQPTVDEPDAAVARPTGDVPAPHPEGDEVSVDVQSPRQRRRPGDFPPIWGNVPLRNANFTGREDLLRELGERLDASSPMAVLPEALHGMGGVGKTLVAVEYVYRHIGDYDLVWWIPSDDPSLIQSSFVELAQKMQLVTVDPSPQVAVPAVLEELRNPTTDMRWLLVFDNADQPEDLRQFLPQGNGHVIVTSRNPRWSSVARAVEVDIFDRPESVELLQRRCPELTDEESQQLANVLGDLPLAIEQAGAWCAETGMSVPEYLALFEQQRVDLLQDNAPIDYPVTVAAAWNVSLDRLRRDCPQALQLVQLCSCFAPEPISRGIFTDLRDSTVPAELADALQKPVSLGRAIREIKRYSLARVDHRNDTIQLHRIVQAVVQDQMSPAEQARMRHIAHLLLLKTDPKLPGVPRHWPEYSSLQPHVRVSRAVDCDDTEVRRLVINQAIFLNAWGDYQGSYEVAEEARQLWHNKFGEAHLDTLSAARRAGVALRNMGEYARAKTLDESTFTLLRETVGDDHEESLMLAGLVSADLRAVGDFAGARKLNEDSYVRSRRVFGDDDPNTLFIAHNLAMSLRLTGDFSASRELDERAWQGRRREFGDDDRFTLQSLDALALDDREAGEYVKASTQQEQTLEAHRHLLGNDHPQTLSAVRNLAVARRKAGDHVGALQLANEAFDGFRRRFGKEHPDSMAAAMNLSIDLRQNGELGRARNLGRRSWERYRDTLGEQHPYTSVGATNLAVALRQAGEVAEARQLDQDALRRFTDILGTDHPFTLVAATNLASDLAASGDHAAALELDTDTLARSRARLGERHPSTLAVALNRVLDLFALHRDAEAAPEHEAVVQQFRGVLGAQHPATLNAESRHRADCDIEPMPII